MTAGAVEHSRDTAFVALANDPVWEWFLPFVRSFREHNPDMPMVVIPYDDAMERIASIADEYRFEIADYDYGRIDRFTRLLFPTQPYRRRKIRKLSAFDFPYANIIYLDIDTVVLSRFDRLSSLLAPGEAEFVYASRSPGWVFKPSAEKVPFLKGATPFSDGFFMTSNRFITTDKAIRAVRDNFLTYRRHRERKVYCQPVINFAVRALGLKAKSVVDLGDEYSDQTFYRDETIHAGADGYRDRDGRKVLFIHWAGDNIEGARNDPKFGDLWRRYSDISVPSPLEGEG